MPGSTLDLVIFTALLCLLVAMLLGVLATWLWALRRLWLGLPLLGDLRPAPRREVVWGGATLAMTVFLFLLVNVSVVKIYAMATGKPMAAPAKVAQDPIPPGKDSPDPTVATRPEEPADPAHAGRTVAPEKPATEEQPDRQRPSQSQGDLMLQSAIINVMLLLLVPAAVMLTSQATAADLGWDTRDWPMQVFHGARAGMLVTPVVFAIQSLAIRIWPAQKHPMEEMVLEQFTPGVAVLAVVSAMFLAPCVEELLFRGLLQQWLVRLFGPQGANSAGTELASVSSGEGPPTFAADVDLGSGRPSSELGAGEEDVDIPPVLAAILTSAALFAGMHFAQWPAPIAIFMLALWLGAIYQRSRSLLTVIALHGTFNGFSTVMLLVQALGRRITLEAPAALISTLLGLMS